jgi:hypothetical protein
MWLKAEGNLVRGKENTGKFRKMKKVTVSKSPFEAVT